MRIQLSACVLLLVSSFCVAQEREQSHHSASLIIVNGVKVAVSPFASTFEAFSKAFNPGRNDGRLPLYAYSMEQLGSEFCQEHGEKLSASAAAFVGPVSSVLTDGFPQYTGVQITDTSRFIRACETLLNEQKDIERLLDDYLDGIGGFGEYLRDGRLKKLNSPSSPKSHIVADNDPKCVRHLKSGTLSSASAGGRTNPPLVGQPGEHGSETVQNSGQTTITGMVNSLLGGVEMWQFTPRDPGQFSGRFLISFDAGAQQGNTHEGKSSSSLRNEEVLVWEQIVPEGKSSNSLRNEEVLVWEQIVPEGKSSNSLWNVANLEGVDIEWEEMSGGDHYRNGHFDMWYFPPFCDAAADDDSWYLVSKYRLGFGRDLGFRADLVPLNSAFVNAE